MLITKNTWFWFGGRSDKCSCENREKLDSWYNRNKGDIDEKMDAILLRYLAKGYDDRYGPCSPKFVLLHTLSHLLIRQLAFESGYNAASLRENIYFSDKKHEHVFIFQRTNHKNKHDFSQKTFTK